MSEVKIRTLPRSKPKAASTSGNKEPKNKAAGAPRWIIYVGTVFSLSLLAFTLYPGHDLLHISKSTAKRTVVKAATARSTSSVAPAAPNDLVARYMQEAAVKHEMMQQRRILENMAAVPVGLDANNAYMPETPDRVMGVQLDQEDTAERLYHELNGSDGSYADSSPHDKINNRLATRRWVNELERTERINFVRNFLKSAYERGYEVQLDQNLVVVGVRKVNRMQKINIDQVVDRMARQGL